jgi:hypothetical protein
VIKRQQGGGTNPTIYHFHPRAFKLILMRTRNTSEYAKYYIFLEECIYYYAQLQFLKEEYHKTHIQLLEIANSKLDESQLQNEKTRDTLLLN